MASRAERSERSGRFARNWRQGLWLLLASASLLALPAFAQQGHAGPAAERDMTQVMTELMLQLAAIFLAAKAGAYVCRRWLKVPEVLGELVAGIIIGPYALGNVVGLFPTPLPGQFPISPELYGIATLASIILLYLTGLETDLRLFLRYSVIGSLVGVGGLVLSFFLGAGVAVAFHVCDSLADPAALFLGPISTATSVGITARVLEERKKLDSPEGVTILAGAVVDDVLGIVVLAVVIGYVQAHRLGHALDWAAVGWIAARAVGFWVVATGLGIWAANRITKVLRFFGSGQTLATMSLGLALLVAGFSEHAGLALIVGAYITGLALSRTEAAPELRRRLEPMYHTLVAVFFCVMGMLVDLRAMQPVLVFGLIFSFVAIVSKILGCALPALFGQFNLLGAIRVGVGMTPRGEVALIVAGVGLSTGAIGADILGISILMTLITTVVAPLVLVQLLDDRSGLKEAQDEEDMAERVLTLTLPNTDLSEFLLNLVIETFRAEGCQAQAAVPGEPIYQVSLDEGVMSIRRQEETIRIVCRERDFEFARLVLIEGLARLSSVFEGLRQEHLQAELRQVFTPD